MIESRDKGGSRLPGCLIRASLFGLLGVILLLALIPAQVLGIPKLLLLGWIGFLRRVGPQISFNPDLCTMAALCLAVILVLSHWFLTSVVNHRRTDANPEREFSGPVPATVLGWNFKWSVALNALMWLSFFVGMSVIGIVHQIGWILASNEPVLVEEAGGTSTLMFARMLSGAVDQALIENGNDVDAALASDYLANLVGPSGRYTKLRPRVYLLVDASDRCRGEAFSLGLAGNPDYPRILVFDDRIQSGSREFASWSDVVDTYSDELVPVPLAKP